MENFYSVAQESELVNGTFDCSVVLNKSHPIYKGHFPEIPVAPGVCLTQMIKEIIENKLKQEYNLSEADNIKFLGLINPMENNNFTIQFQLTEKDENNLHVISNITAEGKTFVKFKGILRKKIRT